jgi:predicted nucleic acid-binding protein
MAVLLWDASALTKRYYAETGSDTVDALFAAAPVPRMVTTFWGYAETYASLWRKRNRGDISTGAFQAAVTLLRAEIRLSPDWVFLTVDDAAVLTEISLLQQHNVLVNNHDCRRNWPPRPSSRRRF